MIRLVMTGAIVVGCTMAGRALSSGQTRRARLLTDVMDAAQILRVHMLDRLLPVNAALSMSASPLLRKLGQEMVSGKCASDAWNALSAREHRHGGLLDSMTGSDMAALSMLFDGLGESGRVEQEKRFQSAIREMGRLEEEARRSGSESARLYTTLGMLTGLALAVGVL